MFALASVARSGQVIAALLLDQRLHSLVSALIVVMGLLLGPHEIATGWSTSPGRG